MKTICEQLGIEVKPGVKPGIPFIIKDASGDEIYYETFGGFWYKHNYDENGNEIYYEDSDKSWYRCEYDENGNIIYFENSRGIVIDNKPKTLTMDEIADKFDIPVEKLKIVKSKPLN